MEELVNHINSHLQPLVGNYANSLLLGLTYPILRQTRSGDTEINQIFPSVVSNSGECRDAVIDTTRPLMIYHKLIGITSQIMARSGFGDAKGDVLNVYNMQLVVYFGRDHLPLSLEELYIQINHYIPEELDPVNPYKRISIKQAGLNANTMQVFQGEYKNVPYRLRSNDVLFTINYSIEAIINKSCIVPIC
jgi:hypothetical protein